MCDAMSAAHDTLTGHSPETTMTQTTNTQTHRIAAIDAHSGYVWGVTDAEMIAQAAVAILTDSDGSRTYEVEVCNRRDADVSLHLYVVADDLAIEDGQDAATIAAVAASTYLGSLRNI